MRRLWTPLALAALVVAMGVAGAGPAQALPVNHIVNDGESHLTADVYGELDIAVNTNLGTVNGTATASGPLNNATQAGNISIDWGATGPNAGWDDQLTAGPGDVDIDNLNPGSATGGATLDLFGFLDVNFDLEVAVDNIGLQLGSVFSASPFPSETSPGSGPWNGADAVELLLDAQIDFDATGPFGIALGNDDIGIGPSPISDIPLLVELERLGGDPGDGSRVSVPIPSGLSFTLNDLPPSTFDVPGCEVDASIGCALDVQSVDVTLTELTLSNLSGMLVADQTGTVIPEPATLGLLALGAGGILLIARRRTRS